MFELITSLRYFIEFSWKFLRFIQLFTDCWQEQGRSLEYLQNEDQLESSAKTEVMLAYIKDCEAYDEEDLQRQNEELRRQIAKGPEAFAEMNKSQEEQIAKLTKGMIKMLKHVKKESQFANYALDTLKNEKDLVNDELQKLLAMTPEEMARVDVPAVFKELQHKVQNRHEIRAH